MGGMDGEEKWREIFIFNYRGYQKVSLLFQHILFYTQNDKEIIFIHFKTHTLN